MINIIIILFIYIAHYTHYALCTLHHYWYIHTVTLMTRFLQGIETPGEIMLRPSSCSGMTMADVWYDDGQFLTLQKITLLNCTLAHNAPLPPIRETVRRKTIRETIGETLWETFKIYLIIWTGRTLNEKQITANTKLYGLTLPSMLT